MSSDRQCFILRLTSFLQQVKWKKSQEHSFPLPLPNPPQCCIFTCKFLNYLREERLNAWIRCDWVSGGWCIDRARQQWKKGPSGWMSPHTCLSAPALRQRWKTYLFMEAEKLTVANPAVQHAVDVDVVGLQDKVGHRSWAWRNKVKQCFCFQNSVYDVHLILFVLSSWNGNCCMPSNATFHCAEGGIFNYFSDSPLDGDMTPHSGWLVSTQHTPADVSGEQSKCKRSRSQ